MTHSAAAVAIAQAIADEMHADFALADVQPVPGGCIHTAMRIDGEDADRRVRYFAKSNAADRAPMFEAESEGLAALAAAAMLRVPKVVTHGQDGEHAWLVLEWLELVALSERAAARLGESLARQHRVARPRFGWGRDNFIGTTPQKNGWSDDWLAFWRANRLHAQLRLAARNGLPSRMLDRGERLLADCEALYRGYHVERSLLHGDLWGGNAGALAGDVPVVFDPAVYVGDREADVAMTELFGGFPSQFRVGYAEEWPLDEGYAVRRNFYNLYHLLNHANLFAGGYVHRAEQCMEQVLAEIR